MPTINESIEMLREVIKEKEGQIELLKKYEKGELEFTENNYHELCKTDLRGEPILGKMLEETFPFLKPTRDNAYPNEYIYSLEINGKNYEVLIPCSAIKNISIIIPCPFIWYYEKSLIEKVNKKLEEIENKINEKTIFGRANYLMTGYKKPFRVLAYLIECKNKKNYIALLTKKHKEIKEERDKCIENQKRCEIKLKEYNETIEFFKENFVPKFLNWTDEVVIKKQKNSAYSDDIRIRKEN